MTLTEYPIPVQPWFVGQVTDWVGPVSRIPNIWLPMFGQSLVQASYWALFKALTEFKGTVTFTNASPAVFTTPSAHGLVVGDPVFFQGSVGSSGLSNNQTYYVATVPTSTTLTIGSTRTYTPATNTLAVTSIFNASGTASGTVYLIYCPHGMADNTHFYLPDARGRLLTPLDNMGGSDAGVLNVPNVLGLQIGESDTTGSYNVQAGGDYGLPSTPPGLLSTKIIYTGVGT